MDFFGIKAKKYRANEQFIHDVFLVLAKVELTIQINKYLAKKIKSRFKRLLNRSIAPF